MKKKIIIVAAVALALITILTLLAIFSRRDPEGERPAETTVQVADTGDSGNSKEGYDENGYILDNIPKDTNFANRDVTFLIWSDHTMNEFFADEVSGDIIADAIHERNAVSEERIGVKFSFVEEPGNASHMNDFIKRVETDISSGSCEFDIIAGYSRTAPRMTLTGKVAELTELDYLDFDMPWWPDALIDQCMLNNRLYYCSGDISTNLLWMMIATFFNKDLIASQGLESPYDLVHNNQWTLDKAIELTTGKYSDLDGGGAVDANDFFGCVIYDINVDAYFTAADFLTIEKNNAGELVISPALSSQSTYDLIDKLGNYFSSNSDVYHSSSTSVRDIFFEQRAILTMDRVFIVAGKDNGKEGKIEFEYGIVPNPKYSTAQVNYSTNVGHPFTMYAISAGVPEDKRDMYAATLECLASESYRKVTPMVFETAMKVKYASDDTATEMYDILRGTVSFDMGRLYSTQVGDVYRTMRAQVINNAKTFASQCKGISKLIENGIRTISAAYDN